MLRHSKSFIHQDQLLYNGPAEEFDLDVVGLRFCDHLDFGGDVFVVVTDEFDDVVGIFGQFGGARTLNVIRQSLEEGQRLCL